MIILLLNGIQAKVIWVRMVCPIGESICRDKQHVWKFGGREEYGVWEKKREGRIG